MAEHKSTGAKKQTKKPAKRALDVTTVASTPTRKMSKKAVLPIRTVQGSDFMQKDKAPKEKGPQGFIVAVRRVLSSSVVLLILLVGVLFKDIAYGEIFLLLYAIAAFVTRVGSETSFRMAFVMLLALPVVGLMNNHPLAQNFAVYGFLLLIVGIISALIEQFSLNRKESVVAKSVVKKV
ncbi:MAG TPA: hypothetical protein VLG16_04930 [Candidatus Saccharimonadales bacterium]|nr:hypothetical protein [Candidatus Saccharimonadales bacterium]